MVLPRRIDGLTGLRAIAALAVVLFHLRLATFAPASYAAAGAVGSLYVGVDLFFVLSGFVLMHVHGAEFRRLDGAVARRFYALRLARIYPVHATLLMLLVALIGAQLVATHGAPLRPELAERFAPEGLARHLLLIGWSLPTWNPPAWSLSAEWTAYLAFPLLAWTAVRLPFRACLAALGALAAGLALVYAGPLGYALDVHGLVRVVFEFPAGCLLYRIAQHIPASLPTLLVAAGAALAAALFGTPWGDLALLPLLAALILAASGEGIVARVLATPPLVWLGEISYSVYMIHVLALTVLGRIGAAVAAVVPAGGGVVALALAVGGIVLGAAALHYTVERPAREWLRRRLGRTRALAAAPLVRPVTPRA